MLLWVAGIFAATSLDGIKSAPAGNKLTAENWDYLVETVSGLVNNPVNIPANIWNKNGNNIYYSTGNVGVGTTSPAERLHVNGSAGTHAMRVQVNGNTKLLVTSWGWVSIGGNNLTPPANGLYVQGNVGVGYSNPITKLDVNGSVLIPAGQSYWIGNATDTGNRLRMHLAGATAYIDYYQTLNFRAGTTPMATFNADGSASFSNPVTVATPTIDDHAATKAYVDSKVGDVSSSVWSKNGNKIFYNTDNVGIGTNNPTARLHVAGSGYFQDNIGIKTMPSADAAIKINDYYGIRINRWYGYESLLTEQTLVISGKNSNIPSAPIESTTIYRGLIQLRGWADGQTGSVAISSYWWVNGLDTKITLSSSAANETVMISPSQISFYDNNTYPNITITNRYDTIVNGSTCSNEWLITFARIYGDTNNSRLFICQKENGSLKWRAQS